MSPIAEADRYDGPGLGDGPVPGIATVVEDGAVGGEHPVGQPIVAQDLAEVLNRVQFRAFGRQRQQGEIGGHDAFVRQRPSRLIEQQHGVRSRRHRPGDLGQMQVQRGGVAARQDEGCAFALFGADRAKKIGRGGALIARRRGPRLALLSLWKGPGDFVLLPDARLVGKPQFYRPAASRFRICARRAAKLF